MCKLLIMTGISESRVAKKFMEGMAVPMSKLNQHGIGYTAAKSNGDIFSERWLNNPSFMRYDSVMTPDIAKKLERFASRLPVGALDSNYSSFGEIDYDDMRTVTMHTRMATCGREFANTHPFIYNDVSLVHNGVIRNAFTSNWSKGLDVNKISTCDSEAALQTYINERVQYDSSKAKGWLDLLTGSWAFGILSRNADNLRLLDVVRGSSLLYEMEIEGLGKVFTTDKDDALLVVRDLQLSLIKEPTFVTMDSMFRFNAVTGELIEEIDVKPKVVAPTYNRNFWEDRFSQTGRTGGTRSSFPSQTSSLSKKDQEYNKDIMIGAMGIVEDSGPDLTNKHGGWDTNKVSRYVNNINEPLLDRLDIFDVVYDRDFADMYEDLPVELQEYVRDADIMQGFRAARTLIMELYMQDNVISLKGK